MNLGFVLLGAVALLAGLAMLVPALKARRANEPKSTAMLIAGMMVTAFGLLLGGFALAYAAAEPAR